MPTQIAIFDGSLTATSRLVPKLTAGPNGWPARDAYDLVATRPGELVFLTKGAFETFDLAASSSRVTNLPDAEGCVLVVDRACVLRLTATGELDPTFGDGGVLTLPDGATSAVLTPGRLFVVRGRAFRAGCASVLRPDRARLHRG
jgi:hypothetical protein